MATLQKHKPKGIPYGGQFDGVHHQYAEVRLRMADAAPAGTLPIDAALAHASFMSGATKAYAQSEALPAEARGVFAVRAGITEAYAADLANLRSAGHAGPEGILGLASDYEGRAAKAERTLTWTKQARANKAVAAGEYRFLAGTLVSLAGKHQAR